MKYKYTILFFLFLFTGLAENSSANPVHPFYLGVTEIRIDSRTKIVQISCRMFTDDLEDAIKKLYDYTPDIIKSVRDQSEKEYLQQYIRERLTIRIGGHFIQPTWVGYEIEDESTWCHLEFTSLNVQGKVEISNNILYDFIPSQQNIIHCYYNDERKSHKLSNPEKNIFFEFE
jgi:hypothetical protein